MLDVTVRGVLLADLLVECRPTADASFVSFIAHSQRNHSTSLRLADAIQLGTLIALHVNGEPLPREHGGPIRNMLPDRYFYKSVKWLTSIELLPVDRLGYWEAESGYHNTADPWHEQRYMAPNIDRRLAMRLIETRDFSGHDLRSIDAAKRDLTGLQAVAALLRDADFRGSQMSGADFSQANLSNAHFERSDLRNAKFADADLEGANFSGADLRGADLRGASLFGTTFWEIDGGETLAARIDGATLVSAANLEALTPDQFEFWNRRDNH